MTGNDSQSLAGIRILVTQAEEQAPVFIRLLEARGADVIHRPAISIEPLDDYSELDACLQSGDRFDWILFTSANAVAAFGRRLEACAVDKNLSRGWKVAVIGGATRQAVQALGMTVNFIPERHFSGGFIEEFSAAYPVLAGTRVLFPAGNIARDTIPDGLRERGAEVARVTTYNNVPVTYQPDEIRSLFGGGKTDIATFTSSSSVDAIVGPIAGEKNLMKNIRAASIGPLTTQTLEKYGAGHIVEATVHTVPGLTDAIVKYVRDEFRKA